MLGARLGLRARELYYFPTKSLNLIKRFLLASFGKLQFIAEFGEADLSLTRITLTPTTAHTCYERYYLPPPKSSAFLQMPFHYQQGAFSVGYSWIGTQD
jgi:hypothetical protein